jgi:transposase-like protein
VNKGNSGYSPEVKAAVMAALLAGQSIRQVAKEYNVPKSTVAAWGKEAVNYVPDVPDAKKERVGELLIDLLIAKLESQIAMSQHAGDKQWLKTQDASAVAMLLGVSDDKLIRLLEKLESAGSDSATTEN